LLRDADLAIANLESPAGNNPIPYLEKSVLFRADPADLDLLVDAGIDLVSLSNNHILDYGPGVAGRTEAELRGRGIAYAGLIREDGQAPRVDLEVRGLKIAFLSYCSVCHEKFQLQGSAPGSAPGIVGQMKKHMLKARQESDFVIVAMHWGQEYFGANDLQRRLAGELAAMGADVVVGHHTHVVQKAEMIGDTLVFYGLGNFLFDLSIEIAQDSVVALLTLSKGQRPHYELQPVLLEQGRPRPLGRDEAAYHRIEWIMKNGYEYGGRKDYPPKMRDFEMPTNERGAERQP
jgi:poly-gamma-glutamate synthesis protein (capsule biosynthesis protein)